MNREVLVKKWMKGKMYRKKDDIIERRVYKKKWKKEIKNRKIKLMEYRRGSVWGRRSGDNEQKIR